MKPASTVAVPCPVCGHGDTVPSVRRDRLPAMQNYVYRSHAQALSAKAGRFELRACGACGFAHNAAFEPSLLDYDEGYDNSVPSMVMAEYYRQLATTLCQSFADRDALLVDIGCGKGTFLKIACELFPRLQGLGVDPSHEGQTRLHDGRLCFIQDVFHARQLQQRPTLVICRHVLEHIPGPVEFLRSVHGALAAYPDTPLYFEVPDTGWIVRERAFWDFCYEHCNYFDADSLSTALQQAGFIPGRRGVGFHQQYLWAEAHNKADDGASAATTNGWAADGAAMLRTYADDEASQMARITERLQRLKAEDGAVAIWGMATKGVVFSFLIDPDCHMIDFCIDINVRKQGCFAPLTGHRIESPETLRDQESRALTVFVMNPNYLQEIRDQCRALGLTPDFLDASGRMLHSKDSTAP